MQLIHCAYAPDIKVISTSLWELHLYRTLVSIFKDLRPFAWRFQTMEYVSAHLLRGQNFLAVYAAWEQSISNDRQELVDKYHSSSTTYLKCHTTYQRSLARLSHRGSPLNNRLLLLASFLILTHQFPLSYWFLEIGSESESHSVMPNCTVHEILQVRILEWVAFPFSRGSSQPRDQTQFSCIADGFFTSWALREALLEITSQINYFHLGSVWRKFNLRYFALTLCPPTHIHVR